MTNWPDNISFGPSINFGVSAGISHPIRATLSVTAAATSSFSTPLQFLKATFIPSATMIPPVVKQPKALFASLTPQATAIGTLAAIKFIRSSQFASAAIGATLTSKQLSAARLLGELDVTPFLSQKYILKYFAAMSAEAVIPPLYVSIPDFLHKHFSIGVGLSVDILPVKFISAALSAQTGISPDITLDVMQWITYGSEVLYAASSGLEKAMIDADAPRILQTNAEAIIDTWDPYNCPITLLPYLAWAMGVTFWNDEWSEETKRTWVAVQWQFKAFRGTDAAINMAVDFAGRDVSPYGYFVRDIITAPQGQYPSPDITQATQEAWLASLPQVRVYLFSEVGQAYVEEFFINQSYLGTGSWDGDSFITPDTSSTRLGRQAVWNVNGVDVSNVGVLDFGNYFRLQMPGQAYSEEFYGDMAWPEYSFCTPNDAWKRLVTISPQAVAPYQIAVGPSFTAVEANPELIRVPGVAGYDVFCGSNLFPDDGGGVFMAPDYAIQYIGTQLRDPQTLPVFPSFLLPSTSDYRIYQRYAVYDPDDLPTGGTQGTMFCGFGWFDYPPFTAEVDVFMAGQRSFAEFSIDDFMMPSGRFTIPQDNLPLAYVAGAIEAARGLTQLTLLQPKSTPVFSAGAPFICGMDHYIVGQPQLSS